MTTSIVEVPDGDPIRLAAAAALADVDALGVQGDDRNIILKALLEARLPVPGSVARRPRDGSRHPRHENAVNLDERVEDPLAEGDSLDKLARVFGVHRDVIDLVYALRDGAPQVVVSARKVSQNKAQGTRELAQLVAASRQAAGQEEWTSIETIRKVVTDYGRYDSANFATTIQQLDKVALVRGKGQQREIKITKPGLESTADLVKTLAGAEV